MASIVESNYMDRIRIPRLTKINREKWKKWKKMKTPNGLYVAYGMLLKSLSDQFAPLENIRHAYRSYLRKFTSKYYIVPDFGPYCSLEKKLESFYDYNYVEKKGEDKKEYKITPKGSYLLKTYLKDKELLAF